MKKAIIFDFDGTIADTFSAVIEIYRTLTNDYRYADPAEIERLRSLSAQEVRKELDIPAWRIPYLLVKGRRLMGQRMAQIKPFGGIKEILGQLQAKGYELYIVSSNSNSNIDRFLKEHGLNKFFVRIYGGIGLFGKAQTLRKIMRHNRLNEQHVFYVGDEVRDMDAAHKTGIKAIAVTWGYNSEAALSKQKAYILANKPSDINQAL